MTNPYASPQTDALYDPARPQLNATEAEEIRRRIAHMNRMSLLLGGSGLLLQGMGRVAPEPAGALMVLVGTVLLIVGLSYYARMRGWSGWFGLVGMLSCIGMIALLFLPKHCHYCKTTVKQPTCPKCGSPK